MTTFFIVMWLAAAGTLVALWVWRQTDHRADRLAMNRLAAMQPQSPLCFHPSMVSQLPAPARRYFLHCIAPGTPLYTVARITMTGHFGLGTRSKPGYLNMTARETLAMPTGFIWKMRAGRGLICLSGSDSEHWTRFWLMGFLPVTRLGDDVDHRRSAFGRYVAEAVFWTPAALLPGAGVRWLPVDASTARVLIEHNGLRQAVDVTVAADGALTQICFARWSSANPQKMYRRQPFVGFASGYQEFSGFRLPTRVKAGNGFGTPDYFPFFIARVTAVTFPLADRVMKQNAGPPEMKRRNGIFW
ncbi:DUF6544 family protein [Marinobacter caseinilyticus]|uniref:DUF6544 family protein n=1 Tax=Marinobacter caseinilyticus TaxID=2692195 RepID=UPI00140933DF|nr:DUF6544 family protein [Marinobacter caseinilyticus]